MILDIQSPIRSLTALFASWKVFLFSIALFSSVAPDYDTSTSLFLTRLYSSSAPSPISLSHRLTRWDALYFIHASAGGGKVYEQEWAFGHGLSGLVSFFLTPPTSSSSSSSSERAVAAGWEPLVAILVANVSHLIGVLALYHFTVVVSRNRRLALVAAALHVISPAGLFLSAPYAESTYSCLTFLGNWAFATAYSKGGVTRGAYIVGAGALFGLATVFRSNGLGSGLLFAVEALRCAAVLLGRPSLPAVGALIGPIIGGLCVAAGGAAPQLAAWVRYCSDAVDARPLRPWCAKTVPSIYGFVQEYYWNVGFLRYWTSNQIPLFVLASPVLALLIVSGLQVSQNPRWVLPLVPAAGDAQRRLFVRALAGTQAFVALLAITNYHVQIVNRLSSGYVVWYWWIAAWVLSQRGNSGDGSFGSGVVIFFVMYAGIQACLFASFLPPA
ncbi:GPI mannosyltransferase 2 [Geosmithia morbida]|uniref:GPI mannosyltransferase 2 n=1 Tax=Geosmithia morbida TaxID=1094350 RepID=A0A9P4YT84_9HYPO|nr:GPI mannosyltransferase 2 [Geosmithia morbida]KAF4122112.1 GPI mannosyltransferase 2 [Geosmithia morbida]